jgi:hypothetical protein
MTRRLRPRIQHTALLNSQRARMQRHRSKGLLRHWQYAAKRLQWPDNFTYKITTKTRVHSATVSITINPTKRPAQLYRRVRIKQCRKMPECRRSTTGRRHQPGPDG